MYLVIVLLACALVLIVAREVMPHTSPATLAGCVGLGLFCGMVGRVYTGTISDGLGFDLHFAGLVRAVPGALLVIALFAAALMRREAMASGR